MSKSAQNLLEIFEVPKILTQKIDIRDSHKSAVLSLLSEAKNKTKQKKRNGATAQLLEWPKSGTLTTPSGSEDVEQRGPSFIADGNTKQHSHVGRQLAGFSQNETFSYHTIQQLCSLVLTQRS